MQFTSPNLVPYRLFSQLKPEDFTPQNLEELVWEMGVGPETDCNLYYPDHMSEKYGGVHAFQLPCQLADFLHHLYVRKDEMRVKSYLELGVYKGGLFYIMDSFFRAINPDFEGSVAVDIANRMFEFKNYQKRFKTVEYVNSHTLHYQPEKVFDLIFVDDDHKYDHIVKLFPKYKPFARYMAFHDIDNPVFGSGVEQFWGENKYKYPHWETKRRYLHTPRIMGIGLIDLVVGVGVKLDVDQ